MVSIVVSIDPERATARAPTSPGAEPHSASRYSRAGGHPGAGPVIPGLRAPHGVVVAGVALASEGTAGPLPGDVIHGVNGVSVRTIADLHTAIAQVPADSGAVLQIGRQGRLRFITVTPE